MAGGFIGPLAEGGCMGKYDDALYDYFSDPERFADFYNGAVFQGEKIVEANMLEDAPERYVTENSDEPHQFKYKNRYRDVKKHARNGVDFAIMAIENQQTVDYTMPWRIMQYDQLEYGRQIRKILESKAQERLKKGKKLNRYTLKLSSKDKLCPVYTTCFYHGTKKWVGPKSLADMMDFEKCNPAMKALFQDYRMNFVCVDDLKDLSFFRTDLKLLIKALQLRKNKEAMNSLFEQEEFTCVAQETVRAIAIMTDYKEFLDYADACEEEGEINMCQAVEEIRQMYINKGMEEGIKEGIKEGIREGIREGICALITTCHELGASYEYVIGKLKEKYCLNDGEIQNYMNLYWIKS